MPREAAGPAPGPWDEAPTIHVRADEWNADDVEEVIEITAEEGGLTVAYVTHGPSTSLIVAAPESHEANQMALSALDRIVQGEDPETVIDETGVTAALSEGIARARGG